MQIDIFTTILATCTAVFVFGGAFLFFWSQDRASKWLAWWIAPYFLGGLGIMLRAFGAALPGVLTFGASNALLIIAFGLVWQGARVFARRALTLPWVLGPTIAWLAFSLLPDFAEMTSARVIVMSVVISVYTALAAFELWRDRSIERLASRLPAVAVLGSFSLLMALRAALANLLPFPAGAGSLSADWLAIMNAIVFAHIAAFVLLMVSLTKERREAEQRQFALLDPLTGLMNRRAFMSHVERSSRRGRYGREGVALAVLDLDHFKSVNDRFGHEIGDRMLAAFATTAEASVRPSDQLYRMGGEEFCLILSTANTADALEIVERIRRSVAALALDLDGQEVRATVSIGLAVAAHAGVDFDVLLNAADAAVYEAKARGRNRVVLAEPAAMLRPELAAPQTVRRRA